MDPISNIPNTQNMNLIDWDIDETFRKISELPPLESFLEFDSFASSTGFDNNVYGFEDIESESYSSILRWENNWSNIHDDQQMTTKTELVSEINDDKEKRGKVVSGRKRTVQLELEEIKKHFHLPITKAAKEMKVGVTVLKKQCREFNIMRWPQRKIKSLKTLIHNVKEMGMEDEIEMLEEHKRMVERLPDVELTQRTKKLRQACFKANYKKKKLLNYSTLV